MNAPELPTLDPIFHQQLRTRIATMLYCGEPSFTELKTKLSITDGNLDAHLRKLSAAGFLHTRIVLEGRPYSVYRLSESGTKAFNEYLYALQKILKAADVRPR